MALKAVHPALQVGGPSSANLENVADLIADTQKAKIPLDFISSHHYPSDPSCSHAGGGKNTQRAECFSLDVLESAALAKDAALPFFLSEYKDGLQGGPGTGFGGTHGDLSYAAAFVVHTLPKLGALDVVSWWTFSDIFEENWMIGYVRARAPSSDAPSSALERPARLLPLAGRLRALAGRGRAVTSPRWCPADALTACTDSCAPSPPLRSPSMAATDC